MKLVKYLLIMIAVYLSGCTSSPTNINAVLWKQYKARYLQSDGRIVDTGNHNISHSEGQGYSLLLAVSANDQQAFNQMWYWTRKNLQIRQDKLFVWRWQPQEPHISDTNNASDGDILIAWALLRAAKQWQNPELTSAARDILTDIKQHLVRNTAQGLMLLPGAYGFETTDRLVLNPSYWVYPALSEFAKYDTGSTIWPELLASGPVLLAQWQQQSKSAYPADWVALNPRTGVLFADSQKPPRFGFEAIRIPLYMAWYGQGQHHTLTSLANFWRESTKPPAWIDSQSGLQADYPLSDGGLHIRDLLLAQQSAGVPPTIARLGKAHNYYSDVLTVLTLLAVQQF